MRNESTSAIYSLLPLRGDEFIPGRESDLIPGIWASTEQFRSAYPIAVAKVGIDRISYYGLHAWVKVRAIATWTKLLINADSKGRPTIERMRIEDKVTARRRIGLKWKCSDVCIRHGKRDWKIIAIYFHCSTTTHPLYLSKGLEGRGLWCRPHNQ